MRSVVEPVRLVVEPFRLVVEPFRLVVEPFRLVVEPVQKAYSQMNESGYPDEPIPVHELTISVETEEANKEPLVLPAEF